MPLCHTGYKSYATAVADPGGVRGVKSNPPLAHSLVWKIPICTFTFAQKYLSGNLRTPPRTPLHRILDPPQHCITQGWGCTVRHTRQKHKKPKEYNTLPLTCREVTMPALEMEILCCSMASWMLVRSESFIYKQSTWWWSVMVGLDLARIPFNVALLVKFTFASERVNLRKYQMRTLSNSSIKQTPLSANTRAPASSVHSLVTGCLWTYAVNPTADAPWPVVNTALCAVFSTYFRNWDFAVPGSPHIRTLMSPRILCLPPVRQRQSQAQCALNYFASLLQSRSKRLQPSAAPISHQKMTAKLQQFSATKASSHQRQCKNWGRSPRSLHCPTKNKYKYYKIHLDPLELLQTEPRLSLFSNRDGHRLREQCLRLSTRKTNVCYKNVLAELAIIQQMLTLR